MRLHFLSKAGAVHYKTLKTRGAINLGEEIGGAAANIGAGVDLLGGLSDAGVALGVGFSRFLGGIFGGDQPGENRYESTKRTTDSCEAILTYDIYRVGEKPLNPSLVRVGDVNDIYQLESNVSFSTVAFFFVPVHRLYGWNRYLIKSRPTDVADYPPNFYVFGYGLVENNAGNQAGNR